MKSTVVLRSLAVVVAAAALVGAYHSAAASVEVARNSQRRITIMVTPQVAPNEIDLGKAKAIDVAIKGEPSWQFSDIDPQTVEFAKAIPTKSSTSSKDWDNDGIADRTYSFAPKDLKLQLTDSIACLTLELINKQKLSGCDKVKVIKSGQH